MTMPTFLDYWAGLNRQEYARHILIYLAVSTLLVLIGPFITYQDPFVWRLSYWLVMLGIYGGVVMPLCALVLGKSDLIRRMAILPGAVVLILIGAFPMTLVVALMDTVLERLLRRLVVLQLITSPLMKTRLVNLTPTQNDFSSLAERYFNVLPIALVVVGLVSLFMIGQHQREAQVEPLGHPPTRPGVSFYSRLPETIGTDLVCMQMEDHYIRVVTRLGEALILVRMRDAIQELAGVGGLQVHRSWWVAIPEIVRLSRNGRRMELTMTNGAKVPVSGRFRPALDALLHQSEQE